MTEEEFELKLMLLGWDTRETVFSNAVLITESERIMMLLLGQDPWEGEN